MFFQNLEKHLSPATLFIFLFHSQKQILLFFRKPKSQTVEKDVRSSSDLDLAHQVLTPLAPRRKDRQRTEQGRAIRRLVMSNQDGLATNSIFILFFFKIP